MSDTVTIVGSVVKEDPELRFTNSGTAVCEFGVRVPASRKLGTEAVIHNVVAWRELAENVAESVQKGDRVVVIGVPKTDTFVGRDGQEKSKDKITAYNVAMDLNYATASVNRTERTGPAERTAGDYETF